MRFLDAEPTVDLTYSDVFLTPQHSAVSSRLQVQLDPHDGTPATLPLVAANMNAISGPRLATSLARRGGIAILPQDLSLDDAVAAVTWVKRQPIGADAPAVFDARSTVRDALSVVPVGPGQVVVVAQGSVDATNTLALFDRSTRQIFAEDLLGVLTTERLSKLPGDATLGDVARGESARDPHGSKGHTVPSIQRSQLDDPQLAYAEVERLGGGGAIAVLDGEEFVGTTSPWSIVRASMYRPAVDEAWKLALGVAIGINGDVEGKASRLAAAGADVLVMDTAHGHQDGMLSAIERVAALDLGKPIVAGNIVTAAGVRDLVRAGASILKVGVGPGAMCTTRMMTAVGRPQFSAVLETAEAAHELGAHVWADGGVRYPRDVALALAAGASSVMIGSWFAGTAESPGALRTDEDGRQFKESWGMASTKAVQSRFDSLEPFERARKQLFAEGISTSKILIDPKRPSIEDLLDMITTGVRSSFTYAGADSLESFHERATVGLQSAAGYEEGKALPVSW